MGLSLWYGAVIAVWMTEVMWGFITVVDRITLRSRRLLRMWELESRGF